MAVPPPISFTSFGSAGEVWEKGIRRSTSASSVAACTNSSVKASSMVLPTEPHLDQRKRPKSAHACMHGHRSATHSRGQAQQGQACLTGTAEAGMPDRQKAPQRHAATPALRWRHLRAPFPWSSSTRCCVSCRGQGCAQEIHPRTAWCMIRIIFIVLLRADVQSQSARVRACHSFSRCALHEAHRAVTS